MNEDAFDEIVDGMLAHHNGLRQRMVETIIKHPEILDDLLRILTTEEIVEDWPESKFANLGEIDD